MTEHQFFNILRKGLREKNILAEPLGIRNGSSIRFKDSVQNIRFCPVTAVAWLKTNEFFSIGNFRSAGKKLHMSDKSYFPIVYAADSSCGSKPSEKREIQRLRRKLLRLIKGVASEN